ncbi:hypothetical protein CDES_14405 (plasmid) [Corynebacterium deserti GIMN1.010]|uniref:Uncharacterized protein n=1 Tax=Corynebacterium deserti GIMN1.010 TaxID=931089 RepID=A0A0M3QAF1_9CORY|nr:hypothetical protein CDES_14405 [Corynebacterium deserti GIMN1.010]
MLAIPTIGRRVVAVIKRAPTKAVREIRIMIQQLPQSTARRGKQTHMPGFAAFVCVHRIDQPDRLGFAVLGINAHP